MTKGHGWFIRITASVLAALGPGLTALLIGAMALVVPAAGSAEEPMPVYDVENPARQPWQRAATSTPAAGGSWDMAVIGTVPQGKRLVLEFVAVSWALAPGQSGYCVIGGTAFAQNGHIPGTALQAPVSVGQSGTMQNRVISQPIRLYGNPGNVALMCYPNQGNGLSLDTQFRAMFVGYLVDTGQ